MSVNRLSGWFSKPRCKCCKVRRKLRRVAAECNAVEKLIGNVAEFFVPDVAMYLKGERQTPRLFLVEDFEPAPTGADMRTYAAGELRRVALQMLAACDRLEGGAA